MEEIFKTVLRQIALGVEGVAALFILIGAIQAIGGVASRLMQTGSSLIASIETRL